MLLMVIIIMIRILITERMIGSNGSNKITIIVVKWLIIQTTKNWSGKNAWKYLLLKVTNTTAKKKLKNNAAT